jgi:hypothetical protein
MKRFEIIQLFIEKYNYKKYVEIGTQHNASFNRINIDKVGVDPDPASKPTFCMTSDKFFEGLSKGVKKDIYFIDGMHEHKHVYRDINNALKHLTENGTIICHDCNPQKEIEQRVPRETKRWNGDCWKAIVQLRSKRDDLEIYTIDTDEGCTVIRKSKEKIPLLDVNFYKETKITYENLEKNRVYWLNLISVEEFLKKLGAKKALKKHKNQYKVHQFQPYSIHGNYGEECRYYCDLVTNENDWIILADYDVMCLTPSHIHKIREYIDAYPDTGMFLPYVNRVKQHKQVYDMKLFDNPDVKVHKALADSLAKKPISVTELNIVISGYFMVFKKSTYTKVGMPDGLLGMDNRFSHRMLKAGLKLRMMNTMYCFHYYRMNTGVNDKSHLKNILG